MMIVGEAMVYGLETVGKALAFTNNFGKAKAAVNRIFQLLDRTPLIVKSLSFSEETANEKTSGRVEFENVHLRYTTRSNVTILNKSSFFTCYLVFLSFGYFFTKRYTPAKDIVVHSVNIYRIIKVTEPR